MVVVSIRETIHQLGLQHLTEELKKHSAIDKQGVQVGVIAQEIEQILPDVVKEESTGVKSVNPDNITWYLVNAIKELKSQNEDLKSRIETLET
jgi:hypothetical protein